MWEWARDLDQQNLLWREFCRPAGVETGSKEDLAAQLAEGWILGASSRVINARAAVFSLPRLRDQCDGGIDG